MSDYTPTTEEIRDAFCEAYPDHLSGLKSKEFDRWLERFGKTERLAEREHIIALIEHNLEDAYGDEIYDVSDLIALIKGEQS